LCRTQLGFRAISARAATAFLYAARTLKPLQLRSTSSAGGWERSSSEQSRLWFTTLTSPLFHPLNQTSMRGLAESLGEADSTTYTTRGRIHTPEEDVMIHRLPRTPAHLDLAAELETDWRDGDVW
jgi:hypothetical protein